MKKETIIFKKIAIIGIGLIGGSVALAVKEKKLAQWIIGAARRKQTIQKAFRKKAVDVATLDIVEAVQDADLVVLCTPVSVIVSQLRTIAPYLKKGAIVIDVGSSKGLIYAEAKKYLKGNLFIGCHPMAGSENGGVENASVDLFVNSVCFVTKPNAKIISFWKALGAKVVLIDPLRHDEWVAKASHLPHAIAFSLMADFMKWPQNLPVNPSLQTLARIAKSSPELWSDIFLSNRQPLLKAMASFEKKFVLLKKAINSNNSGAIKKLIAAANENSPSNVK